MQVPMHTGIQSVLITPLDKSCSVITDTKVKVVTSSVYWSTGSTSEIVRVSSSSAAAAYTYFMIVYDQWIWLSWQIRFSETFFHYQVSPDSHWHYTSTALNIIFILWKFQMKQNKFWPEISSMPSQLMPKVLKNYRHLKSK